jgi:CrcB protein
VPAVFDRRELAAVGLGGAAGTLVRVWVATQLSAGAGAWPWATFLVNISGSFALAYIATRLRERGDVSAYPRALLASGFCGAYTTFSTMQLELLRMLEGNHGGLAAGYALGSIGAGLVAIWAGTLLARRPQRLA